MKIFNDFNQNSGGQPAWLFNNLDDYEILRELDDHRIVMKIFNDFNQNSGGQPAWLFNNLDDYEILGELDDQRIDQKISMISIRILVASQSNYSTI